MIPKTYFKIKYSFILLKNDAASIISFEVRPQTDLVWYRHHSSVMVDFYELHPVAGRTAEIRNINRSGFGCPQYVYGDHVARGVALLVIVDSNGGEYDRQQRHWDGKSAEQTLKPHWA